MDKLEYRKWQLSKQNDLLRNYPDKPGIDRDIWNLEYMITQISPGSPAWRSGHIGTLRRAIQALECQRQKTPPERVEK